MGPKPVASEDQTGFSRVVGKRLELYFFLHSDTMVINVCRESFAWNAMIAVCLFGDAHILLRTWKWSLSIPSV